MFTALERIFFSLPTPFNMVTLIVLIACTAGVITSIATQFRLFLCQQQELAFKRDLVERGWSIDEIEQLSRTNLKSEYHRAT